MPKHGTGKYRGISRTARLSIGSHSTRNLSQTQMATSRSTDKTIVEGTLMGLSKKTRAALSEMQSGSGGNLHNDNAHTGAEVDDDLGFDVGITEMQDVEDGGWATDVGEEENFVHDLQEIFSYRPTRKYHDGRTFAERSRRANTKWDQYLPLLVDALQEHRYRTSRSNSKWCRACREAAGSNNADIQAFNISVIDLYSLATDADIPITADHPATIISIAYQGYLGASPDVPKLAISFDTLELYRRLRLRQPSFSVEAFAKVICDFYGYPYRRMYRTTLAATFEIYVRMDALLLERMHKVLGWDGENWRVLNVCACCNYKLEGEPLLKWQRMAMMDGNNSLKRVKRKRVADTRINDRSDYFLADEFTNRFADEVKARPSQPNGAPPTDVTEGYGDPTDGDDGDADESGCKERWKAASADSVKRMWGIFDQTGIFGMACRHHFILWLVDMVRSGELAKYPLAMVAKYLEVFQEPLLLGFDIGCVFSATLKNSSLGPAFTKQGSRVCTNVFHGYAHNMECQRRHHPNIIVGAGIEDFEGMERIFSASNWLARVTRYASPYRRRLWIDLHFRQWDSDKYLNLGVMQYNNYMQSLKILKEEEPSLQEAMQSFQITERELDHYLEEERAYLKQLCRHERVDQQAVAYVQALQKFQAATDSYDAARSSYIEVVTGADFQEIPEGELYSQQLSQTRKRETEHRACEEHLSASRREVIELEVRLGVTSRWTPASPEYQEARRQLDLHEYQHALDNLERLVCQRLFELHKLNASQTGYKMREQIVKALKRRSHVVQNAVKRYNAAAVTLVPPMPEVEWSQISNYETIQEFTLLWSCNREIAERPWMNPVMRYTMKQWHRVRGAQEEIARCNIEIRRLHTKIVDEEDMFSQLLSSVQDTHSESFYFCLKELITRRRRANAHVMKKIRRLYESGKYTGDPSLGSRCGLGDELRHAGMKDTLTSDDDDGDQCEGELEEGSVIDEEEDDEVADQMDAVMTFMGDLAVQ